MNDIARASGAAAAAPWERRQPAVDEPVPWGWLASITALAVALRAVGLDGGMWYDEIRTLCDSVRWPLYRILTVFPGDNQHTLYSVLAHLSIGVFGERAWSLRLPSLVFGAATVPVLYLFAREFASRIEALLACLLLAVAYHHVWYSQVARGYALLAFLTVLSSWLLLRGLRRGRAGDFVAYAAVAALGVYTHLTMVFLALSHALLCGMLLGIPAADRESLQRWRLPALGFVLAAALTLALYAPLLLDVQQFFVHDPTPVGVATPRWAAMELLRGLRLGLGTAVGAAAGGALFLAGLWSYFRQSRFILGLFLLPGAVTVAVAVALQRPVRPRFLFFLAGFALLIVVRGALDIGHLVGGAKAGARLAGGGAPVSKIGIALVLTLAALSAAALSWDYRYPKQDFEGAMRYVDAHRAAGDLVVTAGGATYPYETYYRRDWKELTSIEQWRGIRAAGGRVWVIYAMEKYIDLGAPGLVAVMRRECAVQSVSRGTLGGGDVTVCAAPADGAPGE